MLRPSGVDNQINERNFKASENARRVPRLPPAFKEKKPSSGGKLDFAQK